MKVDVILATEKGSPITIGFASLCVVCEETKGVDIELTEAASILRPILNGLINTGKGEHSVVVPGAYVCADCCFTFTQSSPNGSEPNA